MGRNLAPEELGWVHSGLECEGLIREVVGDVDLVGCFRITDWLKTESKQHFKKLPPNYTVLRDSG